MEQKKRTPEFSYTCYALAGVSSSPEIDKLQIQKKKMLKMMLREGKKFEDIVETHDEYARSGDEVSENENGDDNEDHCDDCVVQLGVQTLLSLWSVRELAVHHFLALNKHY